MFPWLHCMNDNHCKHGIEPPKTDTVFETICFVCFHVDQKFVNSQCKCTLNSTND